LTSNEKRKTNIITVALTGGSGFVGARILKKLLDADIHVRALQHKTKLPPHKNLKAITGGLSDKDSLAKLVEGTQCVIHCGGAVMARNKEGFVKANKDGTQNIIDAAQDANIERFLYISSLAAREPGISPYAASKRAGEDVVKSSAIKEWDIIRPPAIYGPGDQQILPLMRLLQRRVGVLPAGKLARVSVVHVDDLAGAVYCWLSSTGQTGNTYEIDDGEKAGYSWQNLLDKAAKTMNIKPCYLTPPYSLMIVGGYIAKTVCMLVGKTFFLTPDKLRELSHPDWVCHDTDIEKKIGWTPQIGFSEGINQTISWYRQEGLL